MPGSQKKNQTIFPNADLSDQIQEFHKTVNQQTHLLVSNPLQDPVQTDARDYEQFQFL